MATPFSYTVPNWREGSPNAAEQSIYTELMRDPSKNSGMGLLLGNQLAADRHVQERNYMDELAQQHQFAQQQADRHQATQNQETLLKLLERGEKNAGTLGLANNNPSLAPLLAGTDVDMMGQHAQFTKQQTDAEAYEKTGKGYREFREGGGYTPPGVIANMLAPAGVQISDVEPLGITEARERGIAGGVGTASGAPDPAHGGGSTTIKIVPLPGETPEQARARALDLANPRSPVNRPQIVPQRSPVSGTLPQAPGSTQSQQADPGTGTYAPPIPPPGQATAPVDNSLPPVTVAPVQTRVPSAPAPPRVIDVAPSGTPGKNEAQVAARAALPRLAANDRGAYASVVKRMTDPGPGGTNGDVPVALIPGMGWAMLGADGLVIPIPGVSGGPTKSNPNAGTLR